ncbi:MAG: hypothetical protein Q8P25_05210 [Candidatus Curtissbacteria bacterium]|nr:hypothetical protein [Candidatus Curtissbacteria bacterium]
MNTLMLIIGHDAENDERLADVLRGLDIVQKCGIQIIRMTAKTHWVNMFAKTLEEIQKKFLLIVCNRYHDHPEAKHIEALLLKIFPQSQLHFTDDLVQFAKELEPAS